MSDKNKGFSLLELIIVIGVFAVISSLILTSYPRFASRATLDNLAQEVALAIRQAQVYGIAVTEHGVGTEKFPSYGINFDFPGIPVPTITTFVLFADVVPPPFGGDGEYTNQNQEFVNEFTLQRGYVISALEGCTTASCVALKELNITFERPTPDARFEAKPDGSYEYIRIIIRSPRGDTRPVTVWLNGQIATE